MPSTWLGSTPASAIALRMAWMVQAPIEFSAVPSQRRAVGE
jgi:hypothetical protein